jgi:hypothetical protein
MLTTADDWILHTTTFPSIIETIVLKTQVFWYVTPYQLVISCWLFIGTCLHLQHLRLPKGLNLYHHHFDNVIFHVLLFCLVDMYALGCAYFVWPWKSRAPYRDVTSQRGHWPLLICVSGSTWRGSKLLETLTLVRITYAHVWVRNGWGKKKNTHIVVMHIGYIF